MELDNLLWFDEGTPGGETPPNEGTVPPSETQPPQEPTLTKNDILRELSKEHEVNLFDVEGLKQFKEFTESQKTDLEKAQAKITELETQKSQWESTKEKWDNEKKARELGIASEHLEDALKLANNNPDNLQDVLKKYPMFKGQSNVTIGVTDPNNNNAPSGLSEAEKYMAKNPKLYKHYTKEK